MFRVEMFVDDTKLGKLLRSVAGVSLGQPKVHPVVNAAVSERKEVVAASPAKSKTDLVLQKLEKRAGETITTEDLYTLAKAVGLAPDGIAYIRQKALGQKILKRIKRGVFKVLEQQ